MQIFTDDLIANMKITDEFDSVFDSSISEFKATESTVEDMNYDILKTLKMSQGITFNNG